MPPKKRRQKVQTATAAAKAHSQDTTRLINQALAEGNVSRSMHHPLHKHQQQRTCMQALQLRG
jgi:hypothetical protein